MSSDSTGDKVMMVRKDNRPTPLDPVGKVRSVYVGMRSLHRIEVFEKLGDLVPGEKPFEAHVDRQKAASSMFLDTVIQEARDHADKIDIAKGKRA